MYYRNYYEQSIEFVENKPKNKSWYQYVYDIRDPKFRECMLLVLRCYESLYQRPLGKSPQHRQFYKKEEMLRMLKDTKLYEGIQALQFRLLKVNNYKLEILPYYE